MCVFSYTCTGELRMEKRQLPSNSQSSPSGSTLGHCWDRHWSHHYCCCDYYLSYCHSAGYCLMRVTSRHIHAHKNIIIVCVVVFIVVPVVVVLGAAASTASSDDY